jgi:hypothetical protein
MLVKVFYSFIVVLFFTIIIPPAIIEPIPYKYPDSNSPNMLEVIANPPNIKDNTDMNNSDVFNLIIIAF